MNTRDRLAGALDECGLVLLAQRARAGYYSDYLSPIATPKIQLIEDLIDAKPKAHKVELRTKIQQLLDDVMNGKFDDTKEESDVWAASPEGQALIKRWGTNARKNM